MDEAVVTGELDNGLRYYVRQNARPEARAELRLVVNAGSVLEDDTQRGLAHLLEHMAFNGTASFEKQELVDYLESIGMAFGPSINAYTSFDETVYILRVPTDDAEALATGFQILEEWAHQVTMDPVEVDKERGVVIEEWRLGRGAQARIRDEQFPVLFADSRYAERLPIGDPDVLRTFPQEEIERFYTDWYRPDLMAVVAVGDFDPVEIEGMIRTRFSEIPAPDEAADRPLYPVPEHEETYFSLATDPELPQSQIGLVSIQDPAPLETVVDLRGSLVEQLANAMLNARLQELAQRADPPFLVALTSRGGFVRTASAYQLLALVPEDGHARGFEAILTEAERAARHGFTAGELDRQKAELLRRFERLYAERENQESAALAGQYVSHFLTGSVPLSAETRYQAAQALLPTITLDDVNAEARRNLDSGNRVVTAQGIDKPGVSMPTEAELRALMAAVEAREIDPYVDTTVDEPLVAEVPDPGRIVAESTLEAVGVTEWRLSNGATVWLKPTDFKDDEIVFAATSPGGWSLASLDEHQAASNAATFVSQGGVGAFSRIDLQKALAGRSVSVSPAIGELRESMRGSASPKDLETFFQLVWLRFTAPRADEDAFAALKAQLVSFLANRNAVPAAAFSDTLTAVLTQNDPRSAPPSADQVAAIRLADAMDFYRERFADGGDFHFVFVGAFELDEMRPLVEQWLASLPDVEGEESWRDLDIDPPTGVVEKTVRKGVEPQSQTVMVLTGPFASTPENRVRIRALAEILQVRLRETLREDLGGTYSVGVSASYDEVPEERYSIRIQFGADPSRVEELKGAVFREIDALVAEGPTALDVEKAAEGARRSLETNLESNGWWAAQLRFSAESGGDPAYLVDMSRFDAITAANVQDDAARWLGRENLVVVTLLPETPVG
jgi:zinc protease